MWGRDLKVAKAAKLFGSRHSSDTVCTFSVTVLQVGFGSLLLARLTPFNRLTQIHALPLCPTSANAFSCLHTNASTLSSRLTRSNIFTTNSDHHLQLRRFSSDPAFPPLSRLVAQSASLLLPSFSSRTQPGWTPAPQCTALSPCPCTRCWRRSCSQRAWPPQQPSSCIK